MKKLSSNERSTRLAKEEAFGYNKRRTVQYLRDRSSVSQSRRKTSHQVIETEKTVWLESLGLDKVDFLQTVD